MSGFTPTPFARSLTRHLCAWKAAQGDGSHPLYARWSEGLHPSLRDAGLALVAESGLRLHDYARAVSSSQVFAFNLFLPWVQGPRAGLERLFEGWVGEPVEVHSLAFEWVPPGAWLGEVDGEEPREGEPATGVDVVLWGRTAGGEALALLVEVKLGEGGFTHCGGRGSRANRDREPCEDARVFLQEPQRCYLRRPWRKRRDRLYWTLFEDAHGSVRAAFPGVDAEGACPFAGEAQQPMRNLAVAQALVQRGRVARAVFGLCAHDHNPDVLPHWQAWRSLLPATTPAPILAASRLLAAGREDGHAAWAAWMAERYRLELP